MFALRREHLALPSGGVLSPASELAVVMITKPKNKRSMGKRQFSTIRSSSATVWAEALWGTSAANDRLWPFSPAYFSKFFKKLTRYLHLEQFKFTPASLRAGGSTHYYQTGHDPSRLKYMGRWASERSVAHYLQESMSHLILIHLEPQRAACLKRFVEASNYTYRPPQEQYWQT